MKKGILTVLSILCATLAAGCADRETGTADTGQTFRCEEGETFVLSYEDDGNTAVVKLSNETRRLPLESTDGGLKYSTEGMWLWTEARGADFAEVDDAGVHRNCHAQTDG